VDRGRHDPVAYAPSSVVLDEANNSLLVANDKGIGARNSFENRLRRQQLQHPPGQRHVSIVPGAGSWDAGADDQAGFPEQPLDLTQNIRSASGGSPKAKPVAIPAKVGDPSLIKHVFLISENRTYDQVLGDVAAGNGDSTLAVFAADHAERA